jgi:predicted transcriptional regulator of viral defense system
MHYETQRTRALRLARKQGALSAAEAARHGIHSQVLSRLVEDGILERARRGWYRHTDAPLTEHHGLALVAGAAPDAVVCLLSAMSFHGIGTQLPTRVWIAVDRRARKPALEWPPTRVFRFGGEALTTGIETHTLEGVPVKIYSVAKTVADLFKYRNKVGVEVAIEALRDAWREDRFEMGDLNRFGRICRVERVMLPYLEAITS